MQLPFSPSHSAPDPRQNHLLAALSPEVQGRLFPALELADLPVRALLHEAGGRMRHAYFPTDAIISMQHLLESGASTAVALVGNEGLLGVHLVLGEDVTPTRSLVQCAGHAWRLPRPQFAAECDRHGELLSLSLRYTQALIAEVSQTAVCNRHHSIDQQLCRWLLMSIDRSSQDSVTMTQEFIANMLGVRRAGVTAAAARLQEQGVIAYGRGRITVVDRDALERLSCECYGAVKRETGLLLHYLPQSWGQARGA